MKRFMKKSLTFIMIATMLLPTSVIAKKTTMETVESPPTVATPASIPTDVSSVEDTSSEDITTEEKIVKQKQELAKKKSTSIDKTESSDKMADGIKKAELEMVTTQESVTKELLITTTDETTLPKDGKVLSSYEDTYLVSFPDEKMAKAVYEDTKTDASLNTSFGIATGTKGTQTTAIEPDVLGNLEEVIKEDEKKDSSFKITDEDYSIALIDTGVPKSEKNVEYVSMLDDDGYDEHGHGTSMLESIRKQDKDAKILSIKALDKNGYGDAATIYAAIKYAIERKVDIINLSISGFATEGNKYIEDVIKEAIKQGIIVVGAAGNDNLPASAFIPGGIDEIIVVGACNENNERKAFSNYGITVDYYANASSTSQASAIVTGAISANKGDVKKLDDIFFKTPDLSIFDEKLKTYCMPRSVDSTEPAGNDGPECTTEEEFLSIQLLKFVNTGGAFYVAGQASNRVVINKVADPKGSIKQTYANTHYYVIDDSRINVNAISVVGDGWSKTDASYEIIMNADGLICYGPFVRYQLPSGDTATHTVPTACTITIPQCAVDTSDGSVHDWVITIPANAATFYWGNSNTKSGYKSNRKDLILMQLVNGSRPWFTTGSNNGSGDYTKVDSAVNVWFDQSISGAPAGSIILTGFRDLDQWHKFPNTTENDNNYVGESIIIGDANTLASPAIWIYDNSILDIYDAGMLTNGVVVEAAGGLDDERGTVLMGVSATGGSGLCWTGARCQTQIGLNIEALVTNSTVNTYVSYQTAGGTYPNWEWTDWGLASTATATPGTIYNYVYGGTGNDYYNYTIYNINGTWEEFGSPYYNASARQVYYPMKMDANFYIRVPRNAYTYSFNANKPAGASANVTNMPDNITKWAENYCGNYNRTPSLKGWIFKGFYDTSATSGGNLYNPNEQMVSNKTFYARWEPMKYYIRYNANGSTNFNENATNGMQAGEYTQNTTGGATAYQIFTYDSAGEALRANGFSRRGYDFVCWNTTASRTGTDYNPGYVKPANVNWIKGDNTDTPTAALDGTHTYPVVDLYAVWRQKLGTANLNVVSEETGNPVRDVVVSLKNTHTGAQVGIRTTDVDGNAGATGTTGVTNLHWFPYSWNSVSVPAGYKDLQTVTLDINPANSSDNSFLNVNSSQILYMKHVKLTINSEVSDIIDGENAPNFMYHITGVDVAGVTHSYDVMVQTEERTGKGVNIAPVAAGAEEPYMFAGTYTVTQYDVLRYIPQTARNISNVTPVGKNANINLKDNTTAEVLFPYTIKQYGGFSGVRSLLNQLTK